jgi:peptide/nickel transport system ATP-binding protein
MSDAVDPGGGASLATVDLKKYFTQNQGFLDRLVGSTERVKAVDGVSLELEQGETLAVVGESGCGKSTLARAVLNLDKPTDGSVYYEGEDITGLSDKEMRPYRRKMQVIFQDPLASLNPRQTVGEILTAAMAVHEIGDDKADRLERAQALLERVGLSKQHVRRYPNQFSGGQQQRIAIARALSLDPEVLIADEPVSALDVSVQAQILNLLEELQEEYDLSMLYISHDLSTVRQISDRVAVMYLGEFVETAPTAQLFDDPSHPYTKSLLSAVPRINPDARTDRVLLEGTVPSPVNPPSGCRFHTRCPVVIPPDDWRGDPAAFRAAFSFRNRVEADEVDVDGIRIRLEGQMDEVSEQDITEYIAEEHVDADLDAMPAEYADAIRRAAEAIAADEGDEAESVLAETFTTPCESDAPVATEVGDRHEVRCHRHDDGYEADPVM